MCSKLSKRKYLCERKKEKEHSYSGSQVTAETQKQNRIELNIEHNIYFKALMEIVLESDELSRDRWSRHHST
jgi:hypothetical protein